MCGVNFLLHVDLLWLVGWLAGEQVFLPSNLLQLIQVVRLKEPGLVRALCGFNYKSNAALGEFFTAFLSETVRRA